MKHAVIVPVYNEAAYIAGLLDSLLSQTLPPDRIIVVNDNSTDTTESIVNQFAEQHPSVTVVRGGPNRGRAYRVVEVFDRGYELVKDQPCEYVSKLDADIVLPPNYFEVLLGRMDADTGIGAASGVLDEEINGKLERLRLPDNHVPGALKTYKKPVFDRMGGFVAVLGWDILDLVAMRRLGYHSATYDDLPTLHRRRHASADGILKGNVRMGGGAYKIGSHPLFMAGRAVYRMLEPPYLLGGAALWWGYVRAWLTRQERISDKQLMRALREEQVYRLFHRNRLPSR